MNIIVIAGLALAAFVNVRSGAEIWYLAVLMAVTFYASWTAIDYAGMPTETTVKRMETGTAVFVIANYLLLGVLPLMGALWLA